MEKKSRKGKLFSRRGILPILGTTFLIPFLGYSNPEIIEPSPSDDEEYQTLLKPDGTVVKVKVSTLKKSKVVKKNLSNKSFLNWLGKKS